MKTVNFDDPGTYHLYYGNTAGSPGSLMTFFQWKGIRPGTVGAGQSTSTAFSVPAGSLGFWTTHFADLGIGGTITSTSSSEEQLLVKDPDGLHIELVATHAEDPRDPWDSASVPAEFAIRGQHSSVLTVRNPQKTVAMMVNDLGMHVVEEVGNRTRVGMGDGGNEVEISNLAAHLDPEATILAPRGRVTEQGMNRWFRRLGEGNFDVDDVIVRAGELAASVRHLEAVATAHGVNVERHERAGGHGIEANELEIARAWIQKNQEVARQ